ncbi:ABC transporter ATP-binding protein [Pseudodesulfovibrio tunisiensis]|uniref:ABC transporter ATP-binding protein n=1 Tax=Pseudodesulfovibrio tunisiensis TaxID=463192 RepID=UPI001FB42E82|nr:ABC transporter ATP-binding protein [Pseudodesulfovibrio tunisiensis]
MILNVNSLRFEYGSSEILRDVTFGVAPGEILVILGPNGVGKTTLLKCLNAIHRPGGGSVAVQGEDLSRMAPLEIARRLGYVAQRPETGRITAFDAILMGRRPHIRWRVSRHDLEIVDAAVNRLGLKELALRHIDEMSGGELQKVCIARALVQEPHVLLLDEPTSSLDLFNQMEILAFVREAVDSHDMAAVMTMHDLNQALRFGDKFLFLKDGTIFAATDRASVTPEIIEEVYGLPVHIEFLHGAPVVVPLCQEPPAKSHPHTHAHGLRRPQ